MLNLPERYALTDGAYCLSFLEQPAAPSNGSVVFMPHHKSEFDVDWRSLCSELNWTYASPTLTVEEGLATIRSARLVVTEAMHGAIVADIYRVPWVPIRYGFRSLDAKWDDWCHSVSLRYLPIDVPPLLDARLSGRETMERMGKKMLGSLGLGKPAWRATPVFRSGRKARERALNLLRRIPCSGETFLSSDPALERIKQRLSEQIERFRMEYER
jgi:succinoglycan biosynthesis protein ExoV